MYPLKWRKKWPSYSQLWEGWHERGTGVFWEQAAERLHTHCLFSVGLWWRLPRRGSESLCSPHCLQLGKLLHGVETQMSLALPPFKLLSSLAPELALCHTASSRRPPRSLVLQPFWALWGGFRVFLVIWHFFLLLICVSCFHTGFINKHGSTEHRIKSVSHLWVDFVFLMVWKSKYLIN